MPTFSYNALDSAGSSSRGEIDASTRSEAYKKLLEQKLRPVRIESAVPTSVSASSRGSSFTRLSPARQLLFTEELADLLESGLQLEPALRVIENREEKSPLKTVAAFLRQQIREGKSLASALRDSRGGFSELYINMVAAGEASGSLNSILRRQAQHTGILIDLQKRIVMALIYPSIVFSAGILLLAIFMLFLLPQLTTLLTKTGQQLPIATRLLIATSEFFSHYWWALALAAGIILAIQRLWVRTRSGRMTWDRLKLKIPLIGSILKLNFLAQYLQTLATLVGNGVVLLNGLVLVRNTCVNTHIRGIFDALCLQVGEGASLSRAMRKFDFFPPVLIDIVGVGEQTGNIGFALQRGAQKYDKEFGAAIQRLTILIQPVTILFVALFVGLVAYSMITGILTSVSGLRMR